MTNKDAMTDTNEGAFDKVPYCALTEQGKALAARFFQAISLDEELKTIGLFGPNFCKLVGELAEKLEPVKAETPLPQQSVEILAAQVQQSDPDFYISEQHGQLLINREDLSDPAYKWRPVWLISAIASGQLLAFMRYPDQDQPSDHLALSPIELEAFQRFRETLGGVEIGLYESLCVGDIRIRRLQHENSVKRAKDAENIAELMAALKTLSEEFDRYRDVFPHASPSMVQEWHKRVLRAYAAVEGVPAVC